MSLICPVCETPIPDATVTSAAARINQAKAIRHGKIAHPVAYLGRMQTIREWCAELHINRYQLRRRIAKATK